MSGSNCNPLNWSWATLSKVLATTAILFYLAYLYRLGYAKNPEQEYEGSWWNDYQLATGRLNKGRKEFLDRMGTKLTSYVHKATGYRPDETWSTEVVEFIEVVKLTPGLSNGLKSKTGLGGLMVAGSSSRLGYRPTRTAPVCHYASARTCTGAAAVPPTQTRLLRMPQLRKPTFLTKKLVRRPTRKMLQTANRPRHLRTLTRMLRTPTFLVKRSPSLVTSLRDDDAGSP